MCGNFEFSAALAGKGIASLKALLSASSSGWMQAGAAHLSTRPMFRGYSLAKTTSHISLLHLVFGKTPASCVGLSTSVLTAPCTTLPMAHVLYLLRSHNYEEHVQKMTGILSLI